MKKIKYPTFIRIYGQHYRHAESLKKTAGALTLVKLKPPEPSRLPMFHKTIKIKSYFHLTSSYLDLI